MRVIEDKHGWNPIETLRSRWTLCWKLLTVRASPTGFAVRAD
jgi:hypothetical protein